MNDNVLVCPSCGAPTSNHLNCEYCGSMLVRFVDNNIDILSTHYVKADNLLPGLAEEIQTNFLYQKQNENKNIITSLCFVNNFLSDYFDAFPVRDTGFFKQYLTHVPSIERSSKIKDENGMIVFPEASEHALALRISIYESWREKKLRERFKKLKQYPLFIQRHIEKCPDPAGSVFDVDRYDYFIDFGCDVKGAAVLYSEILREVYLINEYSDISFKTQIIEEPEFRSTSAKPLIPSFSDGFGPLCASLLRVALESFPMVAFLGLLYYLFFFIYNLKRLYQSSASLSKLEVIHFGVSVVAFWGTFIIGDFDLILLGIVGYLLFYVVYLVMYMERNR